MPTDTTVKPGELATFTPLDKDGNEKGPVVKVQYNPSSIFYTESSNFSEDTVPHGSQQNKGNTVWNSSNAPRWSFSIFISNFVIEGIMSQTLAITSPSSVDSPLVTRNVEKLRTLLLDIDSSSHEPREVKISLGSIRFFGNCISFNSQYKDFDAVGHPTSANVSLEFIELPRKDVATSRADLQSPDVTHSVSIGEGDHLTAVSQRMYGKPSFFKEIARVNRLDSIRGLEPGTVLYLPPLEKS